jgi:hypothetical protein
VKCAKSATTNSQSWLVEVLVNSFFLRCSVPSTCCVSQKFCILGQLHLATQCCINICMQLYAINMNNHLMQEEYGLLVDQFNTCTTGAFVCYYYVTNAFYSRMYCSCRSFTFLLRVALRTTPRDSSGIPHILEHLSLCGSAKYPVRDPFFKMLTRSLSTFMNAFTGDFLLVTLRRTVHQGAQLGTDRNNWI